MWQRLSFSRCCCWRHLNISQKRFSLLGAHLLLKYIDSVRTLLTKSCYNLRTVFSNINSVVRHLHSHSRFYVLISSVIVSFVGNDVLISRNLIIWARGNVIFVNKLKKKCYLNFTPFRTKTFCFLPLFFLLICEKAQALLHQRYLEDLLKTIWLEKWREQKSMFTMPHC